MYGPESLSPPRFAANSSFYDALAQEADRKVGVMNAARKQKYMVEAAKYGTQGTRASDSARENPFASALADGAADLTRAGIDALFSRQSGSALDSATRQAMQPSVYSPSASSIQIPSWTSSSFSPSGDSLLGSLTRRAMQPPVFGS